MSLLMYLFIVSYERHYQTKPPCVVLVFLSKFIATDVCIIKMNRANKDLATDVSKIHFYDSLNT